MAFVSCEPSKIWFGRYYRHLVVMHGGEVKDQTVGNFVSISSKERKPLQIKCYLLFFYLLFLQNSEIFLTAVGNVRRQMLQLRYTSRGQNRAILTRIPLYTTEHTTALNLTLTTDETVVSVQIFTNFLIWLHKLIFYWIFFFFKNCLKTNKFIFKIQLDRLVNVQLRSRDNNVA